MESILIQKNFKNNFYLFICNLCYRYFVSKRKLSRLRLYKILKIIVLIYSVPISLYGIYGIINYESFSKTMLDRFYECGNSFGVGEHLMSICGSYMDSISQYNIVIWFSLISGIGLLVVFFGGIKIYKYLFPKSK